MSRVLFAVVVLLLSLSADSQAGPAPALPPFDTARASFVDGHFDVALSQFKQLLQADPGNVIYAKFAAEAALNTGDSTFAVATLEPLATAHPDDWQVHMLLARAFAQNLTNPQHAAKRDAELALLTRLHERSPSTQFGNMRDFLLEKDTEGSTTVEFFPAFVPWGPYKVHLIARFFNASSQPGLRITLESSDFDQPAFAKEHPAEAAAGARAFSLDGYAPDQQGADGRVIQTHYTYRFFIGEPKYDDLRAMVLAIASGKLKPLSSRSGPTS